MREQPASSDWAAGRGEKWRDRLSGMEAMLLPVDEPLMDALRLDGPCRIADIGCGGGGTTLEIRRQAPAGSTVHGVDISPALIEAAQARHRSGDQTLRFLQADVAKASVPEEPYDRLVSRFGIMFYEDPPAAFANLARWLVPGGRCVFAVWGPSAENPWISSVREAAAEVIDVPSTDPEAPGPFRYAGAEPLLSLLEQAGFVDLDVQDWRGTLPIGGGLRAEEAARFALASFSLGELLADAGEEAFEAVRRTLAARFSRHQEGRTVRMDAHVHICTGTRSGRRPS